MQKKQFLQLMMLVIALCLGTATFCVFAGTAGAKIIFVDDTATGGDNGSSWADAFADLQDGLAAASTGDEIWIAAGTYKPGDAESDSFQLINGVGIYGGFAGDETGRQQRDVQQHESILSGYLDSNYLSTYLISTANTDVTAVLNGFSVIGGTYGIHADGSSPTISNCLIKKQYDASIYCSGSAAPNFFDCRIQECVTDFAVQCQGTSVPNFTRCSISSYFGGLRCLNNSAPMVIGCDIRDSSYGVSCMDTSAPQILNTTIRNNEQVGVFCIGNAAPLLRNSTIINNGYSGLSGDSISAPVLNSCIIWANGSVGINSELIRKNISITYSNIQDGYPGIGNIVVDPLFAGLEGRLQTGSPCIDRGSPSSSQLPLVDRDGNSRIVNGRIDMGAYEYRTFSVPDGYPTIQQAIDAAPDDSVIMVDNGTHADPVYIRHKKVTLRSISGPLNCIISAGGSGTAVTFDNATGSILEGFTVTGGRAESGGGIFCVGGTPEISRCIISGNTATHGDGGGLYCQDSTPIITGCLIINNTSARSGGGIACEVSSTVKISNCTVADNTAGDGSGGIYIDDSSSVDILNAIIWDNMPDELGGTATVAFSALRGGYDGDNNLDSDPLFVNPYEGDYRLYELSPCIDAGHNSDNLPETDILGNSRIISNTVDLGAHEDSFGKTAVYEINGIPDQMVHPGEPLKLAFTTDEQSDSSSSTVSEYAYEVVKGEPCGNITFDNATGLFEYIQEADMSGVDCARPFTVKFTVTGSDGTVYEQQVIFETAYPLMDEQVVISEGSAQELPDDTAMDYVSIIDSENDQEMFNWSNRATKNYSIAGKTLIVVEGCINGPDICYQDLPDIKSMNIYAETLIIKGEWMLPQTDVTIHAGTLQFENSGEINTIPHPPLMQTADNVRVECKSVDNETRIIDEAICMDYYNNLDTIDEYRAMLKKEGDGGITFVPFYGDGATGMPAGSISVYIDSFDPGNSDQPFIMAGGKGQGAGEGKPGRTGLAVPLPESGEEVIGWDAIHAEVHAVFGCGQCYEGLSPMKHTYKDNTIYAEYGYRKNAYSCATETKGFINNPVYKDVTYDDFVSYDSKGLFDGKSAIRPGRPGDGGMGGDFSSNRDLLSYILNIGGSPGEMALNTVIGGRAGVASVTKTYYAAIQPDYGWCYIQDRPYTFHHGADQSPPYPSNPLGEAGKYTAEEGNSVMLHPLFLRMVLVHARDTYINGHLDETKALLQDYPDRINRSIESDNESSLVPELQQIRNEMLAILHRIDSHLDFFNNPAGWVPMLSFEANKAIFENEIDHALRVFYVTRWLGKNNKNARDSITALKQTREKLADEIEQLKGDYYEAMNTMPYLEAQSRLVSTGITSLQNQMVILEQKYLEEIERKEKIKQIVGISLDGIKMGLGILSGITQMIPVGQPVLGAIGSGLGSLASIDIEKPLADLIAGNTDNAKKDFSDAFLGIDFNAAAKEINEVIGDKDKTINIVIDSVTSTKNNRITAVFWRTATQAGSADTRTSADGDDKLNPRKAAQVLVSGGATSMTAYVKGITSMIKRTEVPAEQIAEQLQQVKDTDPYFNAMASQIEELLTKKGTLAKQMADVLQKISSLPNKIAGNCLAVDSLNSDIGDTAMKVLDGSTVVYLKEMEQRASHRLLKYHYYMAKAYEYRMLQSYEGKLDLKKLVDECNGLIEADNGTLDDERAFNHLKVFYDEQLSAVAQKILDDYNANPSEISAGNVPFRLSAGDIDTLNAGGPVTINLVEMGLTQPFEENVRIVDVSVSEVNGKHPSDTQSNLRKLRKSSIIFSYFDIIMEYSGLSKLRKGGESYQFRHYSPNSLYHISWGARNSDGQDYISTFRPSAASQSMLKSLIDITDDEILLYSRPAAWADIIITKNDNPMNEIEMPLENLTFEISYDFSRKLDLTELRIMVSQDGLEPYFIVDIPDVNERQDARGPFRRIYHYGKTISVIAPDRYTDWAFTGWTDQNRNPLPQEYLSDDFQEVTVTLNGSRIVMANFIHTVAGSVDTDADFIPDYWEIQYGLDPALADGVNGLDGDMDGDGYSNYEEFRYGTDPSNRNDNPDSPQPPSPDPINPSEGGGGDSPSSTTTTTVTPPVPQGPSTTTTTVSSDLPLPALQIFSEPENVAFIGRKYTYEIVTDPRAEDGYTLVYALMVSPEGMSMDNETGLLTWRPKFIQRGTHGVEVLVWDMEDRLTSATQNFEIAVKPTRFCPISLTLYANQNELEVLRAFRDIRLEKSPSGMALIYLYNLHATEITERLANEPALIEGARALLIELVPAVREGLLSGDDVMLTTSQHSRIADILETIEDGASPELQEVLEFVFENLYSRDFYADLKIDVR